MVLRISVLGLFVSLVSRGDFEPPYSQSAPSLSEFAVADAIISLIEPRVSWPQAILLRQLVEETHIVIDRLVLQAGSLHDADRDAALGMAREQANAILFPAQFDSYCSWEARLLLSRPDRRYQSGDKIVQYLNRMTEEFYLDLIRIARSSNSSAVLPQRAPTIVNGPVN